MNGLALETSEVLQRPTLVAGAGGFIGGHLVANLLSRGTKVTGVDVKPMSEWHQVHDNATNLQLDLSDLAACRQAVSGNEVVFNLAADMGGMGFIENNKALCMLSVLINTHLLMAAREAGVTRYFFASSACVYAGEKQTIAGCHPRSTKTTRIPPMPEDGYGWEKLFAERMCRHFLEDFGVQTRVARYHNVYGPHGTFDGGREKAPAAICRKVDAGEAARHRRDRDLGRRRADPKLHVHRRLRLRNAHARRHPTYIEPINLGSVRAGLDQPARRHRRRHRRRPAAPQLSERRSAGSARPQQRQSSHPIRVRVGALDHARDRLAVVVRLDLRRVSARGRGACLRARRQSLASTCSASP